MKKIYFLLFALCFYSVNAQIITFADANFKAKLLEADVTNNIAGNSSGQRMKIDVNNNGEIEQNEALNVGYLKILESNISNLTGIEYFEKFLD